MSTRISRAKRARYLVFEKLFRHAYSQDAEWRYKLARHVLFEDEFPYGTPATTNQLTGFLDGEFEGDIYGWALNTKETETPPKVIVYADGKPVRDVLPVWYRGDVGPHGFYVDLSDMYPEGANVPVEARFTSGQILTDSPMQVRITRRETPTHAQAVLFLHIPKAAGIAFREAIIPNYKQSQLAMIYPDEPGFLPCDFGFLPHEQRTRFRFIMGHYYYGIHQFLPQDATYVTIVRNPVERTISHFLFAFPHEIAGFPEGEWPSLLVRKMEGMETIVLDNLMVRLLAGLNDHVPPGAVDAGVYERALHNVRTSFSFVGYQDRSGEAFARMQQRFGWTVRPALGVVNRGTLWNLKNFEKVRSAIEHFNKWDLRMYDDICKMFP